MTTENLTLFKALGAKMNYLSQRQRVISQNIANADTPGYRPQDLTPVDFGKVIKNITHSRNVALETTDAQHLPPPNTVAEAKEKVQKKTYDVAPTGNAVVMEEQLINAGRTNMDYNLMTTLYQKNMRMIQIALGTQR